MFQLIGLTKVANTDPQKYTLAYRDLEDRTKGYTFSTKHGTEEQLRAALKESMTPLEIDVLFGRAA
jgi:hypothetical protein